MVKQIRLKDGIYKIHSCSECPFHDAISKYGYDFTKYEAERNREAGSCELLDKPTYISTYEIQTRDDCRLEDLEE